MLPSAIFALATLCFGAASASLTCKSESQPNPIPKAGGTNPTGTINGTIAILPIPLEEARRIIGDNYTIQTGAYHSQLPTFPGNMYPALLQAVVDHDVQANGVSIPDFSRVSIEFPFLSIPGANPNTLFRLAPIQAISATNPVALAGSAAYGTRVLAAVFDPPCDAYASLEGAPLTIFDARKPARAAIAGDTLFTSAFATVGGGTEGGDVGPYPLTFFQRVVQQPIFADPSKGCDRQLRRFDTVVSKKPFLPVLVRGVVWASAEIFQGDVGGQPDEEGYKGRRWHGAWGLRVDTAFVEWNKVDCDSL